MLHIKNLSVTVQEKPIINDISMQFELDKNYCILGKNGSWKSSLAMTIMWHPKYLITEWDILLDGISCKDMSPNERAKKWIFLAFQHIPEIKGLKLFEFLRSMYNVKIWEETSFLQFKKIIDPLITELDIDRDFLRRDVNVGFSWWERRKLEILQLKLLEPKYIFLDEIDSWLDVDAFKTVASLISKQNNSNNCFIVITHIFTILDYIHIDQVYVLKQGKIVEKWDNQLIEKIKKKWFEKAPQ